MNDVPLIAYLEFLLSETANPSKGVENEHAVI